MDTSHICGGLWTIPLMSLEETLLLTQTLFQLQFVRAISSSADSTVTLLEKQVIHQVKVILVTYFARERNYLFLYSRGHGISKLNKQLLRCSFPGDLPKMKLHIFTSCKSSSEIADLRHSQRTTTDCV